MSNEFDAAVTTSLQPSSAQAARVGFSAASDTNPDAYAEAKRVARRTGVPVDTVFAMPTEIKRQDAIGSIDFDTLAKTSPSTAALLADVEKAKVAHDDVPGIGEIERKLRQFGGGAVEAVGMAASGTGRLLDVAQRSAAGWAGLMLPEPMAGGSPTLDSLAGPMIGEGWQGAGKIVKSTARNDLMVPAAQQTFGDQVAGGLGQVAAQILMLPFTRGAGLYAQGADAIGDKIDGDNAPQWKKDLAIVGGAGITGVTEKWALDKLLGPMVVPVKNVIAASLARIGIAATAEGGQEFSENVLHDSLRKMMTNSEAKIDFGQSANEAGVGAAVGGIVRTVVEAGLHIKSRGQQAQQATEAGDLLVKLNTMAEASKLVQRDAETAQAFFQSVMDEGRDAVFITPEALAQSGLAEKMAQSIPAVAEQLQTAAETGHDIRIPLADLMASMAGPELEQSILPHVAIEPGGFTQTTAQEYLQSDHATELQAEVERVLAEKEGNDTFKQSAEVVRSNVKEQLNTAGRFTDTVNDAYSTMAGNFYAVQAARMGMTPEAMFAKYPLQIGAQAVAGQQEFAQNGGMADKDTVAGTQAPTSAGDGSTGSAKAPHVAVAEQILELMDDPVYAYGLRVLPDDFTDPVNPGETVPSSFVWQDGEITDEEINGVSTAGIRRADIDSVLAAMRNLGVTGKNGPNGYYFGSRVVLVRGDSIGTGQDVGETIIRDPEVLGEWMKPTNGLSEVTPNEPRASAGSDVLNQQARGSFNPATLQITLLKNADLSTFLHESGHFFLEVQADLAGKVMEEARIHGADTLSPGEQQVLKDMQATLEWFGVKDLAEWSALDFEEKRSYHEKFARGFEAYLFEGKAPSIELQGVFQRFRAWMMNVYKELKALNVELSDEVRGVFDRMLATNEQIALAEQGRSMMPIFSSPDQIGMTPVEFADYQALGVDATNEAIEDLQARGLRDMQWIHNARGRIIKQLQRESKERRAEVEMEVRREVMAQPLYRAWTFLTGKAADPVTGSAEIDGVSFSNKARLSMGDMEVMGLPAEVINTLKARRMTSKEGLHPDLVAELFEFSSGDELVRRLAAAEMPKDEIAALTDTRMLERYGDLSSPEAIQKAADKAIHNDVRARMIATEMNALAKAAGERKTLASAAKEYAAAMIARLKVRDIRPGQYASAEARAAKSAMAASKSGDLAKAAADKRNELINNYATRAAYDAQEEIERAVRYLKKFENASTRNGLDTDYTDQIDTLLERFDLRQVSNRQIDRLTSMRTWVQSQLNAGEIPQIAESLLTKPERAAYIAQIESRGPDGELVYADDEERIKLLADAIDRSEKRSYKTLTVEEFRGLVDTVKQIEHLGRLKHKILTARDDAAYEVVRDNIAGSIAAEASANGKNTRTANDWLGQKLQAIKQFGAAHIKVATWARIMDGGKDNGPVWRYLVQPANERASQETTMRAEATAKLDAIMRPILDKVPMTDKLGRGRFFPSIGDSLNWQERFAIALNLGNESNTQRLLDGKGWTMARIKPVLDTLTAEEWRAAQAVWDHFEEYRPLIASKELRVSGKEPEWIPARQITVQTADGQQITLRGGYYPVVYDARVNLKASQHSSSEEAKNLLKASYSAATTRRSFTKSRVEEVSGRPLLLNMQGLYSGVNDVIHDLAWHEWVMDANKLLRSKTIDTAIREHYGPEVKREFEKWRDDIVAGNRRLDHAIEKTAAFFRQHVSASALTFNILSAAMQPLGLANSIARVGAPWIGKGVARYVAAPREATREAQAKSEWLANRTRTRFRELNELRNQVQGQTAARELMGRYGYWMMMKAQMMVDVPTWWGAYEKAIADGHDEITSINLADQSVKDSQGGGEEVDQSGVERGGPLVKLFTAFYGFMGTTLNTSYLTAKTESSKAKAAVNMVLVLGVPAVIGSLLKDALVPGDAGDDDEQGKKLLVEQLSFIAGLVAFGREFAPIIKTVAGEAKGQSYSGPAGLRIIPDSIKLAQQAGQGEFDEAFRKAFVNVLGDLTGVPSVQINRTITGAEALVNGDTENPAALAFGFQRPH